MDLHVSKSAKSNNNIFNGWCIHLFVISITPKQIITDTPNLVFYISIICRRHLKPFYEDRSNSVQGHIKE